MQLDVVEEGEVEVDVVLVVRVDVELVLVQDRGLPEDGASGYATRRAG